MISAMSEAVEFVANSKCRFGRRAVFIISGVGMSCCMIALAISTSFPKSNKSAQIAAGCFIYLYNSFVPIGFLGGQSDPFLVMFFGVWLRYCFVYCPLYGHQTTHIAPAIHFGTLTSPHCSAKTQK